jgi:hypothetical protein
MRQSYSRIGPGDPPTPLLGGWLLTGGISHNAAADHFGAKNMYATLGRSLPLLLALGAIFFSASAPAQDACALQCSNREAAWCTGADTNCVFNFHDCMQQCEQPSPVTKPGPTILPCQYAQNALRPCGSQQQAAVDSRLVGTWEIVTPTAAGVARWVWEIHPDGTYSFHAEGPGAVPAHSGTFAASGGQYSLNSTTMVWNDAGTYQLQGATMVVNGKLGTAAWQRVQPKAAVRPGSQPITIRK